MSEIPYAGQTRRETQHLFERDRLALLRWMKITEGVNERLRTAARGNKSHCLVEVPRGPEGDRLMRELADKGYRVTDFGPLTIRVSWGDDALND